MWAGSLWRGGEACVSPGAPPLPSCGQRAQGRRLGRPRAPTRQRDFQTPSADAGFTSPSRVASGFWGSPKRSRGSGRPCPLSSAHAQRPATRQGGRGVLGTGRSRAAGTHPAWWMWTPLLVGLAGADWVSEDAVRMRWGRAFTVAWKGRGTRDVDARLALGHGANRRCRSSGFGGRGLLTRELSHGSRSPWLNTPPASPCGWGDTPAFLESICLCPLRLQGGPPRSSPGPG